MATLQNVLKTFVPQAIQSANTCYQEHLRGTSNQDLYAPIAARIAAYVSSALTPFVHAQVTNNPRFAPVTLIALTILTKMGLNYYGISRGYNVNFGKELMILSFSPMMGKVVENLTTPKKKVHTREGEVEKLDYQSKTDNQRRVALLMHILVGVGTSYALYKLQADRNSSLPLKPYLYFAAGVTILKRLEFYNSLGQKLDDAMSLSTKIRYYAAVYLVASRVLIGFGMAQAVKLATGQPIQMAWHWEIASSAASIAVNTYFS
ncbi:MAG: hypothetical protein H7A41_08240 [Chlamydiales bacterium]|nr:hypothetical protein [Chlamydiales bacterium]